MNRALLLVATQNAAKARELKELLEGVAEVETLADHPEIEMPPEEGDSFEDNAKVKAEHVAAQLGVPVLADDSGLVVDALDGAPGIRSARYAPGTDGDRVAKLLGAMAGVPTDRRSAHFVCAMAFARPGHPTQVVVGRCHGRITEAPRGSGGFGYDPVFEVAEAHGQTMAELSAAEKGARSHRGVATALMLPHLRGHFSLELAEPSP